MATRERERGEGRVPAGHVAVGYTDREVLDRFIEGDGVDLVVRGPVHARGEAADVAAMGPGVTQGVPCLVVPLIRERADEIGREVADVLERFRTQRAPGEEEAAPRSIGETGGSTRGASAGAIRLGSRRPAEG